MNSLISLAICGFILYVLWTVTKPRWDFELVIKPDGVEFVKGIAHAKRPSVENFFIKDLRPTTTFSIYGRREQTGRLTTLIKGIDDDGLKQRIRNYLISVF